MIILDYSQVSLSNIMMQIGNHTNAEIEEPMVRHMILNSIRSYKSEYGREYGELVIACDNKNYWRRKAFPYYKAKRKKSQEESELNWKEIYQCLGNIREEIKQYFPYRVIDIEAAEADDIIGTLCSKFGNDEKILILSGDKDFQQLQRYSGVKQYDPIQKRKMVCENPHLFLKEHIIRGDTGDGIPNILSDDNCLVVGVRQKSIFTKKLNEWLLQEPETFCDEVTLARFNRNKKLIDLREVPEEIQFKIIKSFESQEGKRADKEFMNYFMQHKLNNLLSSIGDFL